MIIFRYLFKEVTTVLLVITTLLLFIFLSNQLVRYLGYAADGRLISTLLFHLILLEIPQLLALLLPLGLFLGILLAYGRLYVDNEMMVLNACGFTRMQLVWMTLPITLIVFFITTALTFWVSPMLLAEKNTILAHSSASLVETLLPGRFQASKDGHQVFYVESMSRDRSQVKNIFVAEHLKRTGNEDVGGEWSIFSAQSGYQKIDSDTGHHYIVAMNGYRYQGVPGRRDYRIAHFSEYGVELPTPSIVHTEEQRAANTAKLWENRHHVLAWAELQWRIAIPVSALLLALLAVPLSRVKPRQGKYAQLLPAILIYIVYANMLFVGRAWLNEGIVSPQLGMWWIHGVILLLALLLLWQQSAWKVTMMRYLRRVTVKGVSA